MIALYALSLGAVPVRPRCRSATSPPIGQRFGGDGSRIVAVREGATETVVYMRRDLPTEPPGLPAGHQRLLDVGHGLRGAALHEALRLLAGRRAPGPARALLISYGVGSTAKALTQPARPRARSTSSTSRATSSRWPDRAARRSEHPLRDPRVPRPRRGRPPLPADDGRQRYDLITGEPPPPQGAGVVNLYTPRVLPADARPAGAGGIATYWLPVDELLERDARAILGAFCDAFDDCSLWAGDRPRLDAGGHDGDAGPAPEQRFSRPWGDPRLAAALAGWASSSRSSSARSSSATPPTCASSWATRRRCRRLPEADLARRGADGCVRRLLPAA